MKGNRKEALSPDEGMSGHEDMEASPVTEIKIGGPMDNARLKTRRRGYLLLGMLILVMSTLMAFYLSLLGHHPAPGITYLPFFVGAYIGAVLIAFGIRAHIRLTRIRKKP